jgi:hypothetical protein
MSVVCILKIIYKDMFVTSVAGELHEITLPSLLVFNFLSLFTNSISHHRMKKKSLSFSNSIPVSVKHIFLFQ